MGVCACDSAVVPLILLKGGQAPEGLSHLVSGIVAKSPFVHFIEMLATSPFLQALMSWNMCWNTACVKTKKQQRTDTSVFYSFLCVINWFSSFSCYYWYFYEFSTVECTKTITAQHLEHCEYLQTRQWQLACTGLSSFAFEYLNGHVSQKQVANIAYSQSSQTALEIVVASCCTKDWCSQMAKTFSSPLTCLGMNVIRKYKDEQEIDEGGPGSPGKWVGNVG